MCAYILYYKNLLWGSKDAMGEIIRLLRFKNSYQLLLKNKCSGSNINADTGGLDLDNYMAES